MFAIPKLLIPNKNVDLSLWAEIACDQHVLDDDFWNNSRAEVKNKASFTNLILPQTSASDSEAVTFIQKNMDEYLKQGVFETLKNGTIYIEREMSDGGIRDGILLNLDLSSLDNNPSTNTFFSEKTNPYFVEKRVAYLKSSKLDASHVIVGINDENDLFFDYLRFKTADTLYDFHLKHNGGRIRGKKCEINDDDIEKAFSLLGTNTNVFIADGNHSVLSALVHWRKLGKPMDSAARYILVEIINIHDTAVKIYPIHRAIICKREIFEPLLKSLGFVKDGNIFHCPKKSGSSLIELYESLNELLDVCCKNGMCQRIEYIHDENEINELVLQDNIIIKMNAVEKKTIFNYLNKVGVLPFKSFSIGRSIDKRYYLETRVRL